MGPTKKRIICRQRAINPVVKDRKKTYASNLQKPTELHGAILHLELLTPIKYKSMVS